MKGVEKQMNLSLGGIHMNHGRMITPIALTNSPVRATKPTTLPPAAFSGKVKGFPDAFP
jgi:hypothetical protein